MKQAENGKIIRLIATILDAEKSGKQILFLTQRRKERKVY